MPAQESIAKPQSGERKCILVLGMHRSGTSLLARLLNLAGAALPSDLLGASEGNGFGHWEPAWLVSRNDAFLAGLGTSWDDWARLDTTTAPPDLMTAYVADLRSFLRAELGDAPLILIKEPRTCRIAPPILRALGDERIRPLAVIPFRNPLEVAGSLRARNGMAERDGILLWLRHVVDAERDSRALPRSFLAYDRLMADWRPEFERLSRQLGLAWPRSLDTVAAEIAGFIDPAARHNHRADADLQEVFYTGGLALRVFAALQALTAEPCDAAAMAAMDSCARQLDEIEDLTLPTWKALVGQSANLRAMLRTAEESANELRGRLEAARAEIDRQAQALEAVYASHSWRLSAPIRAAGTAARAFRLGLRRLARHTSTKPGKDSSL
mgnify:CR=1 FL=1